MPARFIRSCIFILVMAQGPWGSMPCQAAPGPNTLLAAQPVAAASAVDATAAQKSVRALVNAIRYNKDEVAAKHLNFEAMAKLLLKDSYDTATAQQRQAFVTDFKALLVATSFPKGRELFGYLDALLFEAATKDNDALNVKSVVVVHRNLKKVELPIEWVLMRSGNLWQVVDILSMGESTAAGIREEEVLPLLHEGGLARVLAALHERASTLGAKASTQETTP